MFIDKKAWNAWIWFNVLIGVVVGVAGMLTMLGLWTLSSHVEVRWVQ